MRTQSHPTTHFLLASFQILHNRDAKVQVLDDNQIHFTEDEYDTVASPTTCVGTGGKAYFEVKFFGRVDEDKEKYEECKRLLDTKTESFSKATCYVNR